MLLIAMLFMTFEIIPTVPMTHAKDCYLRTSVGIGYSADADFYDKDPDSINPPALFGRGNSGEPIGVSGDFGTFPAAGLAFGMKLLPWLRSEIEAQYYFNMKYDGNANFMGVGEKQPVSTTANSFATMLNLFIDLSALSQQQFGRFEPYVGGGIGIAYNRLNEMTYRFPENTGNHKISITPGGERLDLGFMLAVGTCIKLSKSLSVDAAYRYQDLGHMESERGIMVMDVLPDGIEIEKTSAPLRTHGIFIGLQYFF